MERDELKWMWFEVHKGNRPGNKEDIEKIILMKHSKVVTKVLAEQKRKVITYSICFFTFLGLMVYAFLYLKVNLLISSLIPLVLAGLFLFYKITSETNRYRVLSSNGDKMSIRDSILFFQNKVNKIERIDFISNICLFYAAAIGISIIVIKDKGAISMFNENGITPFLIIFIVILLFAPWLIKHLYQRRYKNLYSTIRNSLHNLDNE